MDGIFISYRRDDSAGYAGRLYDRLAGHFGPDRVFMDVEGIEPGTDFVKAIENAVASCRVLIVLIGDEWLTATDARGRRRLDDPHDFIRLETSAALARDIRVVPVLLDRASMPAQDELPEDLRPLVRRQAVELNHKQWEATSSDLIRTLEKILANSDAPADTPSTPTAAEQPAPAKPPPAPDTPAPPPAATTSSPRDRLPWSAIAALFLAVALLGLWIWWPASPEAPAPGPTEAPSPPSAIATPAPAQLVADEKEAAFKPAEVGQTRTHEVRLRNTGDGPAELAAALEDRDGVFKILVDTCGQSLRPGAGCGYTIAFSSLKPGAFTARLTVSPTHGEALTWPLTARAEAAPPTPAATPPVVAAPTPKPAPTPRPEPAPTPKPEPAPAPAPPRILSLEATPESGGASVCYRVEHSTQLSLTPRPGELPATARNCVKVPLAEAATLTLTAKGPGGSVQRSVRAAPQAAPAPVASAHPRPGDTWIYRSRGKWPTSPARTLQFTVDRVDGSVVYETLTVLAPTASGAVQRRSPGPRASVVNWGDIGWEFSPWLGAFDLPEGSRNWRGIDTPPLDTQWRDWSTTAEVDGRDRIQVPAGTFDAVRIEVWSTRRATGGPALRDVEPTTVHFDIWYAPQAKRYVKMVRTTKAPSNAEIEKDVFELVQIRPR